MRSWLRSISAQHSAVDMPRVDRIRQTGTFANHEEANASLTAPGDAALVVRGLPRAALIRCPCGCGDTLVLNLDRRAGPAWRLYPRGTSLTIYPSYWRDTKCGSHFIVWNSRVLWCDWRDDDPIWSRSSDIEDRVLTALPDQYISYEDLAEQLQEIPWDVLQACYSLVRKKIAVANPDRKTGQFRRSAGYPRAALS